MFGSTAMLELAYTACMTCTRSLSMLWFLLTCHISYCHRIGFQASFVKRIFLCRTKLRTEELLTWNRGTFAEDNKVKCIFVTYIISVQNISKGGGTDHTRPLCNTKL